MEVDFSVIIPVFNSEKTIMKCMESLQQQTVASFEILIIDDGSSDKSGMLCDKIAETDHRFKVIHQKNAGVSSARNTALSMAKGHFVTFVDSDDTVEYNYLECLKKNLRHRVQMLYLWDLKHIPQPERSWRKIYLEYIATFLKYKFQNSRRSTSSDIHGLRRLENVQ